MAFVFRFQKILDYKTGEEEKAQKNLAEWVSRHNNCLNELSKVEISQRTLKEDLLSGSTGDGLSEMLFGLSSLATQLRKELVIIEKPLTESRNQYLLAKREKEVFEILKKKEYQKFSYAQKRKQQKNLDEYGRNMYLMREERPE